MLDIDFVRKAGTGPSELLRPIFIRTLFLLLSFMITVAPAVVLAARVVKKMDRSFYGYTENVQAERETALRDLVWIARPEESGILRDKIFNATLSKEFRNRYQERFGRTEVEEAALAPNRLSYYNDVYGVKGSAQEVLDERQRFGEFMMRRLLEWHVENFAKSDPQMRTVWEAKEKLSKLNVEVASFRIDAQYSIAGNTLDVKLVNPFAKATITLMMDPAQFGPGKVEETLLSIVKPITPQYSIETRWRVADGIISLTHYYPLWGVWSGSFLTSAAIASGGTSTRETLWLAGLTRVF